MVFRPVFRPVCRACHFSVDHFAGDSRGKSASASVFAACRLRPTESGLLACPTGRVRLLALVRAAQGQARVFAWEEKAVRETSCRQAAVAWAKAIRREAFPRQPTVRAGRSRAEGRQGTRLAMPSSKSVDTRSKPGPALAGDVCILAAGRSDLAGCAVRPQTAPTNTESRTHRWPQPSPGPSRSEPAHLLCIFWW